MKYKVFILTVLASVGFFNYHAMFSQQILKLLFYIAWAISLIWVFYSGTSLKKVKYPRTAYVILMACIAFSIFMASSLHQQSFFVSLTTTLPFILAYSFFWIFMKMDLDSRKVMHIYLVLCAAASIVYFCNLATAPNNIFGEPIINEDFSRGIVRLPVVFIEFFPMIVFFGINNYLDKKEKKWLIVIAIALILIFLSVIRQIIALTILLGLWFFFIRISLWKKLALVFLSLMIVIFVLPEIPIYKTMIELSEDQRDENDNDENVRIKAWRYYTYENQTNELTPVLGNGVPAAGVSLWGTIFDSETEDNGCFAADVGWAGFYWYFGLIATAALLYILIKATLKKKPKDKQYLTYWLIFLICTSVASGPILYYWQILDIAICLAMVYTPDSSTIISKDCDNVEDRNNNTKLQQFTRYPQLH